MTHNEAYIFYQYNGWCPVTWAHHPNFVRDALRALRFRPKLKECFNNSQQFCEAAVRPELGLEIKYFEGYAQSSLLPIQHAWLEVNGQHVDLTALHPTTLPPINYNEYPADYAWYVFDEVGPGHCLNSEEQWLELYKEANPELYEAQTKMMAYAKDNDLNVLGWT